MPLQPKFLDYAKAQILLIGHHENALEKATDQEQTGEDASKDKPLEEMEKLEDEDQIRVNHLKGFLPPRLRSPSYPQPPVFFFFLKLLTLRRRRLRLYRPRAQLPRLPQNADYLVVRGGVRPSLIRNSGNSVRRKCQLYTPCLRREMQVWLTNKQIGARKRGVQTSTA